MSEKLYLNILHLMKSRTIYGSKQVAKLAQVALLATIFIILQYCGVNVEDATEPAPPNWLQKSLPHMWPEYGIDAHEDGGIVMEWENDKEIDIVAYHIYRATEFSNDSLGEYSLHYIAGADESSFVDFDVGRMTRYFYKLKVEKSTGSTSAFSDEISYMLLQSISQEGMVPNSRNDVLEGRVLSWDYENFMELEEYCVTVKNENNDLVLRHVFLPSDYSGRREYWEIPDTIELNIEETYLWRIDANASFVRGVETAGSESKWAFFKLQDF